MLDKYKPHLLELVSYLPCIGLAGVGQDTEVRAANFSPGLFRCRKRGEKYQQNNRTRKATTHGAGILTHF